MILLNDGSILVIYNGQKADISSKGVRISPFGEILEEITFESFVKNLSITNNGVLISFTNASFLSITFKYDLYAYISKK